MNSATSNGAEYFYNNRAQQLVGNAKSGITGVIAQDGDGNYIQYNASKGVVLACGESGQWCCRWQLIIARKQTIPAPLNSSASRAAW